MRCCPARSSRSDLREETRPKAPKPCPVRPRIRGGRRAARFRIKPYQSGGGPVHDTSAVCRSRERRVCASSAIRPGASRGYRSTCAVPLHAESGEGRSIVRVSRPTIRERRRALVAGTHPGRILKLSRRLAGGRGRVSEAGFLAAVSPASANRRLARASGSPKAAAHPTPSRIRCAACRWSRRDRRTPTPREGCGVEREADRLAAYARRFPVRAGRRRWTRGRRVDSRTSKGARRWPTRSPDGREDRHLLLKLARRGLGSTGGGAATTSAARADLVAEGVPGGQRSGKALPGGTPALGGLPDGPMRGPTSLGAQSRRRMKRRIAATPGLVFISSSRLPPSG